MAATIAAGALPVWQRPDRWQPLAVLACGMVALIVLVTLTRRPNPLAVVALFSAVGEVIALGVGAGYDIRAGLLAVLLFTAIDLGYWACDTVDVQVEGRARVRALVIPVGGAFAIAIVVAGLRDRGAAPSLPLTAIGLIAAAACVAVLSWLAIGGGRIPATSRAVPTVEHNTPIAGPSHGGTSSREQSSR